MLYPYRTVGVGADKISYDDSPDDTQIIRLVHFLHTG
jgi:hypothetical protein